MRFLIFTLCILLIGLVASAEPSVINDTKIKLNEYGKDTQAKIRALKVPVKAADSVTIGADTTEAEFAQICQDAPWITGLSIDSKHISSLAPLKSLKGLKKLDVFSLGKSKGIAVDLTPVGDLTELEWIRFYSTSVKNCVALKSLKELEVLTFHISTPDSLEFLSGTPKLCSLDLNAAGTSFKTYGPIADLKQLQDLDIYMNKLATDDKLVVLEKLTCLKTFKSVNNAKLTTVSFLRNCKEIETIDMWCCKRLKDIAGLAGLNKVEHLALGGTAITDIKPVAGMSKLSYLDISDTKVSDLSPLPKGLSLSRLKVSGTPVKDLTPLLSLKELRSLYYPKSILATQVEALKKRFPECYFKAE